MKKYIMVVIMSLANSFLNPMLQKAPMQTKQHNIILTQYCQTLAPAFNSLTPQERVFVYYMYRAGLTANKISQNQLHKDGVRLIQVLETIVRKKDECSSIDCKLNVEKFYEELTSYLVFLWTSHGQYFAKEHGHNKKTPRTFNLEELTVENVLVVQKLLNIENAIPEETLIKLFDESYEHTLCVDGSIEQSAVNFYSSNFTEEDYNCLPSTYKQVNSYYFKDGMVPKVALFNQKYNAELDVAIFWLQKARDVAKKSPAQFDAHVAPSIDLLISFLQTGDENYFKEHFKEWIQSKSRVSYCYGPIETYKDPKKIIGTFQAEVTINTVDMQAINEVLPVLERKLPFKKEYMRKNIDDTTVIPNASINTIAFGAGDLGPIKLVAAYCLPNYPDIRSNCGSRQIIYQSEKGIRDLLNADLNTIIFNSCQQVQWLQQHDPNNELHKFLWDLQVLLHETLGHGSGGLHKHTFKQGDLLIINDKEYQIGDDLTITDGNLKEFLGQYYASMEELRAEIIALYTTLFCYDDLHEQGLLSPWSERIEKKALQEQCIIQMCDVAIRRLMYQESNATQIAGAHPQANVAILNYLIKKKGVALVEEKVLYDEKEYTVIGIKVIDLERAKDAVKKLAIKVQTIKSTGDTQGVRKLIENYGKKIPKKDYITILKENLQAVVGQVKSITAIYPDYEPIQNNQGSIIDIQAVWPESFESQQLKHSKLALSKEY